MTPTLSTPGWSARVAPFLSAGVLSLGEAHVVDRLARLCGEESGDILLGLAFAVRAARVGHAGVDLGTIHNEVSAVGEQGEALIWPSSPEVWRNATLHSPLVGPDGSVAMPFTRLGNLLQTARMAGYEARLAAALCEKAGPFPQAIHSAERLAADIALLFPAVAPGDLQRLAGVLAVLNRVTLISGGPGTGKTTTVRKVLCLLWGQSQTIAGGHPPRVALAAPTGKAAARMRESLLANPAGLPDGVMPWIASLQAVTLHRLLGFQPATPSRFRHNAESPLAVDVVVVDEASMVDVAMMCKLVDAVGPDTRLILLGDRNQLASIEAGCVLADLAAIAGSGGLRLPTQMATAVAAILGAASVEGRADPTAPPLAGGMVQFRTAYRFENAALGDPIYRIADASAEPASETYFINEAVELLLRSKSPAVRHVPHIDGSLAPEVLAQVVDQFSAAIAPLRAAPSSTHAQIAALHAIDGVRMLSAHRRGPLGVSALNDAIVAALRTESDRGAWWVGRLILVTSNDHDLQLWNGDVGLVTQNESGWQVVFPTADGVRLVAVPALPEHETAFVMTIHKSQGSQFGHAVVVLPSEETMILSRELVYTGISRAKAQLTLCGDESVLRGALSRRVLRASGLRERIGAIPLPPSG